MASDEAAVEAAKAQCNQNVKTKTSNNHEDTNINSSPSNVDSAIELGSKPEQQADMPENAETNGHANGQSTSVNEIPSPVTDSKSAKDPETKTTEPAGQNKDASEQDIQSKPQENGDHDHNDPEHKSELDDTKSSSAKQNGTNPVQGTKTNMKGKANKKAEQTKEEVKSEPAVESDTVAKTKETVSKALVKKEATTKLDRLKGVGTRRSTRNVMKSPGFAAWVDLTSEPAYFNKMINLLGVKGVRVEEIYSLDDQDLATLPPPVRALIFLFQHRASEFDYSDTDVPDDLWYAQQTANNACASYALLNILNNIPDVELGPELKQFKLETQDMTPSARGDQVARLDHVRDIHNSFASGNDVKDAEKDLQDEIAKAKRQAIALKAREAKAKRLAAKESAPPAQPTRTSGRLAAQGNVGEKRKAANGADVNGKVSKKAKIDEAPAKNNLKRKAQNDDTKQQTKKAKTREELNAERDRRARINSNRNMDRIIYHFCAYMPIGDCVWRLDGLQSGPMNIGNFQNEQGNANWLDMAKAALQAQIAEYAADEVGFNLMAVCHDTVLTHKENLIFNIRLIQAIQAKLDDLTEDWRLMLDEDDGDLVDGISTEFGISEQDLFEIDLTNSDEKLLEKADNLEKLLNLRSKHALYQVEYREGLREEIAKAEREERIAYHGRHDYTDFVRVWLEELANANVLDWLIKNHEE